ncbi:MAG TPA: LysM peptidoglycan-binding domain-containing protein [Gallionella sp.]|nr:LysM peptidoglycan-binding domain-containing protein [Gallionella sp.]
MRKIISLICLLLPALSLSAESDQPSDILVNIRSDAPDRHIVVKGDTLWDISGKFFKDPWKWPQIWGFNKDTIKDPHWIYPGDVIFLDRRSGTLRLGQPGAEGGGGTAASGAGEAAVGEAGNIERLHPKALESRSPHDAIPSIPASVIAPFLEQPLVIEQDALEDAPELIGAREARQVLGNNDTAFVTGLPSDKGSHWQIYRPGKTFIDPDTGEKLGIEAIYLGNAEVTHFADISTIAITRSVQEIYAGDRMVLPSPEAVNAYLPRAPETKISAIVISIYGGVSQGGQDSVITLNKGARDGLEMGHVLALYHKGENVRFQGDNYTLPDERYGLAFVFRVFDKVSYALVMQTRIPVQLLDHANTP